MSRQLSEQQSQYIKMKAKVIFYYFWRDSKKSKQPVPKFRKKSEQWEIKLVQYQSFHCTVLYHHINNKEFLKILPNPIKEESKEEKLLLQLTSPKLVSQLMV